MLKSYIKLMRVHHYIKNLLIFSTLLFSGQFFIKDKFISCLIGFISFCLMSSVVYIINDIKDKEKDSIHPTKCNRPIASGKVSVKNAIILMIIIFIISLICNFYIFNIYSTILLLFYFVLNVAYSFGLKNIAIVDISILVLGFVIRVLYGSLITSITISNWLYLTVIAISFFFALGKRRNELLKISTFQTRNVLKSYPKEFLDKSMYMCLGLANVFYALWSMDRTTITPYSSSYLILTVPIILLITLKYSMNIEGVSDGDPVEVLVHDKILILLCFIYILLMFFIIYF